MPIPLTLAFVAMRFARAYHASTATARPIQLRKVYAARCAGYGVVAAAACAPYAHRAVHADDFEDELFVATRIAAN